MDPNWEKFFEIFWRLPEEGKRVARLIGVEGGYINNIVHQGVSNMKLDETKATKLRTHKRFWVSLILGDLAQEVLDGNLAFHILMLESRFPWGSYAKNLASKR